MHICMVHLIRLRILYSAEMSTFIYKYKLHNNMYNVLLIQNARLKHSSSVFSYKSQIVSTLMSISLWIFIRANPDNLSSVIRLRR